MDLKGILVGLMERIKQYQVSEGKEGEKPQQGQQGEEPQQGQQGEEPGVSPSPSSSSPPPKVKGRVPPETFGAIGEYVANLAVKNAMSAEPLHLPFQK